MPGPRTPAEELASVRRLYLAAAVSNFVVTVPALVDYERSVPLWFGEDMPRHRFLLRIWAGMAFLWGVSFLQVARDPVASERLIPYSYLEKTVTSLSVYASASGDRLPKRLLAGVALTDVVWIPLFVRAHRRVRAVRRAGQA